LDRNALVLKKEERVLKKKVLREKEDAVPGDTAGVAVALPQAGGYCLKETMSYIDKEEKGKKWEKKGEKKTRLRIANDRGQEGSS